MIASKCDILIIGSTGMLGNTLLRYFKFKNKYDVIGTCRDSNVPSKLKHLEQSIIRNLDIENEDVLINSLQKYNPKIVINCVGLVKQIDSSSDPIKAININSLFPHKLNNLCKKIDAKLIHISTDCVFDGERGGYIESDLPNAKDLYGKSKNLGEVTFANSITLRTSIIGHEIETSHSLLEWFLSQNDEIKGYKNAIFSGLPTVVLADVIHNYVIPNKSLSGLYHISSDPINKYDLLKLIAKQYKKEIKIIPDEELVIDRSLNSDKFKKSTGFTPLPWKDMIHHMYKFR